MLNEYSPWASAFDLQAMSRVLGFGIFVCGCDEGDDEVREGCEKLALMLTMRSYVNCTNHSFHRGLVCSCFPENVNHPTWGTNPRNPRNSKPRKVHLRL
jgi:hypothetical protein